MSARVDQLVSGFALGDAISLEAVALRDALRALGVESDIYADPERVAPDAGADCRPLPEFDTVRRDGVIYHYAIASRALERFLASPAHKILIYHNVTPARFFEGFDDTVAALLTDARESLPHVLPKVDDVWADSGYNAQELEELGARQVQVVPLIFSPQTLQIQPDARVLEKYAAQLTTILFVGRLAPNKCVEELILTFAHYQRGINPYSRLIVVGSERTCPKYFAMLRMLTGELNLPNVCFERYASPAGLVACYEVADVFVTTSRHEGYCLPLVEAIYKQVPVIARATGGMPEALGGAGVLFDDLEPPLLAELIHRVTADVPLRRQVLVSQSRRMAELDSRSVLEELRPLLERHIAMR